MAIMGAGAALAAGRCNYNAGLGTNRPRTRGLQRQLRLWVGREAGLRLAASWFGRAPRCVPHQLWVRWTLC